ncbi:EAL domain-containing protein [Crocosphaera sp. XPORK-15E]|uniref:EAL domain-containing protein n=1 Tax=Crocosphaera sp. XPORK-15E TaxID=3110247 RepID=UPI002B2190FB|nr:EAL domain-containing protein [Crocosphaera sp. XPORK-15E]MEA5537380.1 EAL domain-containing protein [Crocosphaera sp. XPORK-15E]
MNNFQPQVRHLLIIEDKKYRQTISLQEESYSIGRHPKNSIVINSHQASRHHGTLMRRKNRVTNEYCYWILDGDLDSKKSRNGIYVNGQKCVLKELKSGDLVNFGCEVNATYYALNELSNTVIDLDAIKSTQLDKNALEIQNNINFSETNLDIISAEILNPKDTLQAQEYQDPLTKLPNRILFKEYLSIGLKNASQCQSFLVVMLLDINHFKAINKNWGYPVGDQILQEVAKRLDSSLRNSDIVARWGDDEFVLLFPKISQLDDLEKIMQRIMTNISKPLHILEHQLYLEYSIGQAIYPQEGQDAKTLLRKAEVALLNKKKQLKIPDKSCQLTIDPKASKLLKAKTALQQALEQEELILYYQPQIKIETGEVSGIEALVRWNHPNLGQISPQKFIPLAEQTDLILGIGKWILRQACYQNKAWQDRGLLAFPISVNLSPRQLEDPNFIKMVKQVLGETKLAPHWLELEITEKFLLNNPAMAHQVLHDLRELGVYLSMDDFGSGYSCLNHLPKFPFGTLKIAQSCIKELTETPESIAVIAAAIALGKSLDLRVVAEGVETQQQLDLLRNLDCLEMQGYLLSHPLTQQEATSFLSLYHGRVVAS